MNNDELLLALSDLIDKKNKPIKSEIQQLRSYIENDIKTQIDGMREDSKDMRGDIVDMRGDIADIREDIFNIQGHLKNNVDLAIRRIQLTLENDITPRMKTIESCYTDTFDRFRNGADDIEGMKVDIEIMKRLLKEHQEKLQSF